MYSEEETGIIWKAILFKLVHIKFQYHGHV